MKGEHAAWLQRVRAAAGASRDYGATREDVIAAALAGFEDAGGTAAAVSRADELLAELAGRSDGHQAAA